MTSNTCWPANLTLKIKDKLAKQSYKFIGQGEKGFNFILFIIYACYKQITNKLITVNSFISFIDLNYDKFNELCNVFFVTNKVDIINWLIDNEQYHHLMELLTSFQSIIDLKQITYYLITKIPFINQLFLLWQHYNHTITKSTYDHFILYYLVNLGLFGIKDLQFTNNNPELCLALRLKLQAQYNHSMQFLFKDNFNDLYVALNNLVPFDYSAEEIKLIMERKEIYDK